jgi:restriction endonuclease S subunit
MKLKTFFDNFAYFTNSPNDIQKMHELTLQLAVSGRLSTQDQNDEPASKLLEKIRAEKQKLVRDGKIKALKQLPAMIAEDLPYIAPSNWEWVRLSEIGDITTGNKDVNEGSPTGKYLFFSCAAEPLYSDTFSFEGESLILPGNGANVGLVTYFDGKFELYQRTYVVNNIKIFGKYVYVYLRAYLKQRLEGCQFGSAINYIKIGNLTDFLICVPPLAEQKRIVTKVDQLMALCDQLQTQLKEAKETSEKLTAAAVANLTASA